METQTKQNSEIQKKFFNIYSNSNVIEISNKELDDLFHRLFIYSNETRYFHDVIGITLLSDGTFLYTLKETFGNKYFHLIPKREFNYKEVLKE